MSEPSEDLPAGGAGVPPPLLVAASLVLVEGLMVLLSGIAEVVFLDSDRLTMGVTVSVFFLGFGLLLLACAWGLSRLRPWARGPVLLAQLITLGLAWSFRDYTAVAIGLAVVALVVLAGVLHPRSIQAIEQAADRL